VIRDPRDRAIHIRFRLRSVTHNYFLRMHAALGRSIPIIGGSPATFSRRDGLFNESKSESDVFF